MACSEPAAVGMDALTEAATYQQGVEVALEETVEELDAAAFEEDAVPPRKLQRTSRASARGVSAAIAAERNGVDDAEDAEDGEAGVSHQNANTLQAERVQLSLAALWRLRTRCISLPVRSAPNAPGCPPNSQEEYDNGPCAQLIGVLYVRA